MAPTAGFASLRQWSGENPSGPHLLAPLVQATLGPPHPAPVSPIPRSRPPLSLRRYKSAPIQGEVDTDDQQPAVGGLGETAERCAERNGDPGPIAAPFRLHPPPNRFEVVQAHSTTAAPKVSKRFGPPVPVLPSRTSNMGGRTQAPRHVLLSACRTDLTRLIPRRPRAQRLIRETEIPAEFPAELTGRGRV